MSRIAQDLAASAHTLQINCRDGRDGGDGGDGGGDGDDDPAEGDDGKMPNIAIVGAGVAGLRCAATLLRGRRARVTVFEARDRIGGRLHQQRVGRHWVDMGANWIHGTSDNPVMRLAERTGTSVFSPPDGDDDNDNSQLCVGSDGRVKSAAYSRELSATVWGVIVRAFQHSDEHSATIDPALSLADYFREQLPRQIDDGSKLRDALDEARMWGQFIGDAVERQSLKFFFLEQCVDEENVFVAGTYRRILDEIAGPVLDAGVVQLGTEVTGVELVDDGVRLATSGGACAGAATYDEVVVTCPLGWLKQYHGRVFRPPLPPRLRTAIGSIGYGHLEKVYVSFATAWWLADARQPARSAAFFHMHAPAAHPMASSTARLADWNQSIVSLAHLPPPHAQPTLLFYIYGDCAATVVGRTVAGGGTAAEVDDILTAFARPFYSRLPNYAGARPTACLATAWSADGHAGNGSYSNFPAGCAQADRDVEEMRNAGGLWQRSPGGLWLAGEHTAPFAALGTTTGAWWSGEAVARRICQKWRIALDGDENRAL